MQTLAKFVKDRPSSWSATLMIYYTGIFPHLGALNLTGIAISPLAFFMKAPLPNYFYYVSTFNLLMTAFYCYNQYRGYLSATEPTTPHRKRKGVFLAITLPAYWLLQWYADIRAIKQHYFEPRFGALGIFWEKTDHRGRNVAYLASLNAASALTVSGRPLVVVQAGTNT
jgi:hypothetical protein